MTPELREQLLALRLHNQPCEHDSDNDQTLEFGGGAYNTDAGWRCSFAQCPGGAAVAVVCETCDGTGEVEAVERSLTTTMSYGTPCSDCVEGVRILKGRIIEWCKTHQNSSDSFRCTHYGGECNRVSVWLLEAT